MKKKLLIIFAVCLCIFALYYFRYALRLIGPDSMTIEYGSAYEDPGAENLLKNKHFEGSGTVDTQRPGTYTILYDSPFSRLIRTVEVVDSVPPMICLKGSETVYLAVGESYTEAGAAAEDNADGDLTDSIRIEGEIDSSKEGTCFLSYYAKDSSGNESRKRRKIVVVNDSPINGDKYSFSLEPFYSDVVCGEREFDQSKFDALTFFGDSFVGYLEIYGLIKTENTWWIDSCSTDDFSEREILIRGSWEGKSFLDALTAYKPESILILVNDHALEFWTVDYFKESCSRAFAAAKEASPDTTFVICSLPPFSVNWDVGEMAAYRGFERNDRINKNNAMLCEICRSLGMRFMNAAEVLKDASTGACRQEYVGEDDYHLSEEGFTVMTEYIKTHMDW